MAFAFQSSFCPNFSVRQASLPCCPRNARTTYAVVTRPSPAALPAHSIQLVKKTLPSFRKHSTDIVLKFYETLFERYPELKRYFNIDRQQGGASTTDGVPSQVAALARTVIAAAANLEDMSRLHPVIEKIAHKHVARGISASQYDAVGECLIFAMQHILQDSATDEVVEAWAEAYGHIKKVFIDMERDLCEHLSAAAGFSGFQEMEITDMRSGALGLEIEVNHDGRGDLKFSEGQFVAIDVSIGANVRTMTSMKLVEGRKDRLTFVVPPSAERASIVLRESIVGDFLLVSMPCGKVPVPM